MKKRLCSYLPSSFPESCCWKGHKSSAALKQCCYLNIQNKTQLVSCYWKEESTAAKKKKKAFKLSVRLYLAGEVTCARRNSSQKRGAAHCRHLPGMRRERWNILVLFYPGWCPKWCSPKSASLSPGSRHAGARQHPGGYSRVRPAKGTQGALSASCCGVLSDPGTQEKGTEQPAGPFFRLSKPPRWQHWNLPARSS